MSTKTEAHKTRCRTEFYYLAEQAQEELSNSYPLAEDEVMVWAGKHIEQLERKLKLKSTDITNAEY